MSRMFFRFTFISRLSLLLLLFLATAQVAFSQFVPYGSADATNYPRHETVEQRIVEVRFNGTLGGSTAIGQWTIKVANTDAILSGNDVFGRANGLSNSALGPFTASLTPTGTSVFIKFDATGSPGHVVGQPFVLPGESVTITFVNTGSTLTGGGTIAGFGPINSANKWTPTCTDVKFNSSGIAPFASQDQCSPVNTNFWRWTYEYTLLYRNSTKFAANNDLINVKWQNPAASVSNLVAYLTDAGGTPSSTTYNVGSFGTGIPSIYQSFRTGFNPVTLVNDGTTNAFSYPDNTGLCNFLATIYPWKVASYSCQNVAALVNPKQFDSYDYDNTNPGSLALTNTTPPTTPTSDKVCLGTNVGVRFNDASLFNCIGNGTSLTTPGQGAQPTPVNSAQRWVRFVYGGVSSPTAQGNIRDIHVNGAQVTDPVTGLLPTGPSGYSPNSVLTNSNLLISDFSPNATPLTNGYVVTGLGGPGVEDNFGVIQLNVASNATTSGLISKLITTLSTTNHVVGQRFYVTIQYWNLCNPYPTSAPVELSTSFVEIVTKPPTPVSVDKNFCSGNVINPPSVACASISAANQALSFEITAASIAGSTGVNWYFGDPRLGGALLTSTYGSNCRFFRTGDLANTGAQGTMKTALTAGTIGTYSLWATQVNTGTNTCESLPVEVKMIINPLPAVSNQTPTAVCSRTVVGVNFNASTNGTAAATYNVTALNLNGMSVSAGGAAVATGLLVNALADDAFTNTASTQKNVVYTVVPVSALGCAGPSFTVTVPVNPEPAVSNQTKTICSDAAVAMNFGASSGVAASTYNVTGLNLNGLTVSAGGAAIANSLANTALADDAFTNTTSAAVNVVYTVVPVSALGCTGSSFTVTITVNPKPVVTNQAPTAVCSTVAVGVNFAASASVAASTYNVTGLNLNGLTVSAGGAAIANGLANTALADDAFTNVTNAQVNVVYTVVPVSASGCQGTAFTVTVPVNPQPVVPNQTPTAICSTVPVGVSFGASTNGLAAATYNVTALNLNGLTVAAGGAAVATGLSATALADDAFNNTTSGQVNVIYTVRPVSAGGCLGASFTVTVPVNPQPVVANQTPTSCSRTALGVNFNSSTSVAATSYNVTSLNLNGLTVFAGGAAVANGLTPAALADDAFTNSSGVAVNVVYTVVPVSASGCLGNSFTVTATINPLPIGSNVAAAPICSNNSVGYNIQTQNINTNNSVPSTFSWLALTDNTNVSGESLSANTSSTLNDVLINTSGSDQNVIYTITPTSVAGCPGANFTVSVIVRGPTVSIGGAATQAICAGNTLPLTTTETYTSGSFTGREWSGTFDENFGSAPGLVILTNAQMNLILGNRTLANPTFNSNGLGVNKIGSYVLTYTATDNNGCDASALVTVNVSQVGSQIRFGPTAGTATNTSLNATTCSGVNLFLNGTPTGGSGTYPTHVWSVVTPAATPIATVLTAGATTATPTFNFSNSTSTPAVFVLRYSVTDNQGCNFTTGAGTDITINVNPQPVVANQTPTAVCSRTPVGVNFNASTSVAAATYNVTALNLNGLTVSAGGAAVATGLANTALADDAFTNTTAAQVNVVYTVVPVSGAGCLGSSFTVTVPVDPQPVVAAQTPTTCSDVAVGVNFNASTSVAAATYNVTALNLNGLTVSAGGAAVANGLANTALADDAFTNTTAAAVNVVYTVVPVSAIGCTGASFTVTVTVNPEPSIGNQAPAAICSNVAVGVNFSASSGVAAATYNVTALNLNGLTVSAGGAAVANGLLNTALANDAFTNTTAAQVSVIYTVVPVAAGGCLGNSFTVTVPVNPEPVVGNQTPTAVCSRTPVGVNFNASTSVAAATYNVTALNLNGLTVSAGGAAVATGLANTALADDAFTNTTAAQVNVVYTVVPVSGAGCLGSSFTVTVPVDPQPVVAAQTPTTCSDVAVGVNFNASTSVAAATYNVTALNLNGLTVSAGGAAVANGLANTALADDAFTNTTAAAVNVVYTVVPVSAIGCTGASFTVTVRVNPKPVVGNQTPAAVCSLSPVGVNFNASTSVAAATYNVTALNLNGLTVSAGGAAIATGL